MREKSLQSDVGSLGRCEDQRHQNTTVRQETQLLKDSGKISFQSEGCSPEQPQKEKSSRLGDTPFIRNCRNHACDFPSIKRRRNRCLHLNRRTYGQNWRLQHLRQSLNLRHKNCRLLLQCRWTSFGEISIVVQRGSAKRFFLKINYVSHSPSGTLKH